MARTIRGIIKGGCDRDAFRLEGGMMQSRRFFLFQSRDDDVDTRQRRGKAQTFRANCGRNAGVIRIGFSTTRSRSRQRSVTRVSREEQRCPRGKSERANRQPDVINGRFRSRLFSTLFLSRALQLDAPSLVLNQPARALERSNYLT